MWAVHVVLAGAPPQQVACVLGRTAATGAKVALCTPYRSRCFVDLPGGYEEWADRWLPALATAVRGGGFSSQAHLAPRFKGYDPDLEGTGRRRRQYALLAATTEAKLRQAAVWLRRQEPPFVVHEDGLDAATTFLMDSGVVPCAWHRVAGCSPPRAPALFLCDWEATVPLDGWTLLTEEAWAARLPPLVVASLEVDAEGAVTVAVTTWGEEVGEAEVLRVRDRPALPALQAALFERRRVDVVAGHDLLRAHMGRLCAQGAGGPWAFGARVGDRLRPHTRTHTCATYGTNVLTSLPGAGFVYVDTHLVAKATLKLRDNSLAAVLAAEGEPGGLPPWLAVLRLLRKWDWVRTLAVQARTVSVPAPEAAHCGQALRVRNYVLRAAKAAGMVVNGVEEGEGVTAAAAGTAAESAVGGWVLPPVAPGLHPEPVALFDFASLYPSVQVRENRCYSTWCDRPAEEVQARGAADRAAAGLPPAAAPLPLKTYHTPTGVFTFAQGVEGVVASVLKRVRAERARYKEAAEAAPAGSAARANARTAERALKEAANALYGVANFDKGCMPCPALGAVTTYVGRCLNQSAAAWLGAHVPDARVLYGDTDSLFVHFAAAGGVSVGQARRRGAQVLAALNAHLGGEGGGGGPLAVRMVFEKVYCPWLCEGKKAYAGLAFQPEEEEGGPPPVEEWKGGLAVRRDVPQFVLDARAALFDARVRQGNLDLFFDRVDTLAEQVCLLRLPLDQYVVTTEVTGFPATATTPALAALYGLLWGGAAPVGACVGDRVPFVVVTAEAADGRRLRRPPCLGGGGGGGGVTATASPTPTKLVRCARHPAEFGSEEQPPPALDVMYYTQFLCTLVGQMVPEDNGVAAAKQAELMAYAGRVQGMRGAACAALGRPAEPPKLSHRCPAAAPVRVTTTLWGETVRVDSDAAKRRARDQELAAGAAARKRARPAAAAAPPPSSSLFRFLGNGHGAKWEG